MTLLDEILLVDDSESDLYLHRLVIDEAEVARTTTSAYDGREAMDYLTKPNAQGVVPHPELIFLDINMPRMDGWEFLAAYESAALPGPRASVVVMLTTSNDPEDAERVRRYDSARTITQKPLTTRVLFDVLDACFPGRFAAHPGRPGA